MSARKTFLRKVFSEERVARGDAWGGRQPPA